MTPVADQEVLEESYGGGPGLLKGVAPQAEPGISVNAHTLTYIRQEAISEVMTPLTEEDVPLHLSKLVSGWCEGF